MATITAGDYTVEFFIDADKYAEWKREEYEAHKADAETSDVKAPAYYLKECLIPIIEEAVTKQQKKEAESEGVVGGVDSGSEGTSFFKKLMKKEKKKKKNKSNNENRAKVADIQFSFNNHELIEALRTRGGHIAYNKFDEM